MPATQCTDEQDKTRADPSKPSPVYQCKKALRRNMAVKYSATLSSAEVWFLQAGFLTKSQDLGLSIIERRYLFSGRSTHLREPWQFFLRIRHPSLFLPFGTGTS